MTFSTIFCNLLYNRKRELMSQIQKWKCVYVNGDTCVELSPGESTETRFPIDRQRLSIRSSTFYTLHVTHTKLSVNLFLANSPPLFIAPYRFRRSVACIHAHTNTSRGSRKNRRGNSSWSGCYVPEPRSWRYD